MEFGLILLVFLPFVVAASEFYRLSLSDQALARATHLAAMAAGRDPGNCEGAVRNAFQSDSLARWLFDRNDDGRIGFVSGEGPSGGSDEEVRIEVEADDGDLSNGIDFSNPNCGVPGSWIRVRVVVPVRSTVAFRDVMRQRVSWAMNQE